MSAETRGGPSAHMRQRMGGSGGKLGMEAVSLYMKLIVSVNHTFVFQFASDKAESANVRTRLRTFICDYTRVAVSMVCDSTNIFHGSAPGFSIHVFCLLYTLFDVFVFLRSFSCTRDFRHCVAVMVISCAMCAIIFRDKLGQIH